VRKNIRLSITTILFSILILTTPNAELNVKVIISVGDEIITNYDLDKEINYLNIITVGQINKMGEQESKKIAIDSLIKDKIKIAALSNYKNIIIKDELLNNQINKTFRNIGFRSAEDFMAFLKFNEYELDEFKEKILLELKWNQLVYQFYKNQIVIDKKKIDKKLKILISEQKKNVEYLVYEIFIEDAAIKKSNKKNKKISTEHNIVNEEQDGIIIVTESASYNNKKKLIDSKKTIEEVTNVKIKNQITIVDLIKNIKKKGFEDTAIQFSSSPSAQQGGRLGWISESKFSQLLINSIKKTKIGSITEPIPISGGILILKVENKRVEENKIDIEKKMKELIDIEKNRQLNNFSTNYFNQVKNNIKIKYFND